MAGLKAKSRKLASPSARKVWIEIKSHALTIYAIQRHLPQGRCGLKLISNYNTIIRQVSPSARKVWIEINAMFNFIKLKLVTFRKEGVD